MKILFEILAERGLSAYEILLLQKSFTLLITLTIVTTISGFFRYIVGLKSLNLYSPIILTFAFFELGYIDLYEGSDFLRGIKFGLFLFFIVFITSTLIYGSLKKIGMHYIPKITIVITCVVLTIILAIILTTLAFNKTGLVYLDIFSIIMITTLADSIVSTLARKTFKYTFTVSMQTLLTALLSYALISIDKVQEIIIDYFFIIIFIILILNLYIGKFIGLRVTEFLRFKDLLLVETSKNAKKNITDPKKQEKSTGA